MHQSDWRAPTNAERHLVDGWVDAWNAESGDQAKTDLDLRVRSSCGCGTCPSFIANPLLLEPRPRRGGLLSIGGPVSTHDGIPAGGLNAFGFDDESVEFEIYPLGNERLKLDELKLDFLEDAHARRSGPAAKPANTDPEGDDSRVD